MNQLTPKRPGPMVHAVAPKLPAELENEVWSAMHPHPDVGYIPRKLPAACMTAAKQALARYESMCIPVSGAAVAQWMLPLVKSVNNAPDQIGFTDRVELVLFALEGLPGGVLNEETQREAVRTFRFFPGAAEVYDLLAGKAHDIKRRRWALAEIVNSAS